MRFFYLISFFLISFDAMSGEAGTGTPNKFPIAKKIPFEMVQHGDTRTDHYYWLRDDSRSSEALLDHLGEENRYTDQWFQLGQDYKAEILKELLDQIPEEAKSITFYNGGAGYFSKMFKGNEHPVYFQKLGGSEKVIFDLGFSIGANFVLFKYFVYAVLIAMFCMFAWQFVQVVFI